MGSPETLFQLQVQLCGMKDSSHNVELKQPHVRLLGVAHLAAPRHLEVVRRQVVVDPEEGGNFYKYE